ncbi:MAG TPA: DUF3850 domain-containing protein [Sporosarcina psychrophila]|uniref:DUF3850 domain-containing protein n=1 Tax=Sporosarcina psychrophila TaxID=1476 RepID=A0A921KE59_SPOPS|nr:DUF3850 domain-containing protein [Sporosarcina psychrophila]
MSKVHQLKILPEYFNAVRLGVKTFEIRKNDRDYQVGDSLFLKEYEDGAFTGNALYARVTYITDYLMVHPTIVMAIELDD